MPLAKQHNLLILSLMILLLCVPGISSNNYQYIFETIDISDGLSQNSVMTMTQDKFGYIWIGTEDGLNRYDGSQFKLFRHDPLDEHSLSSSSILASVVDDNGDLWVGTYAPGLNKYRYDTEDFERFTPDPNDSLSIGEGSIWCIHKGSNGQIWIGVEDSGVYRLTPETGHFININALLAPGDSLNDVNAYTLMEDHQKQLWIGTFEGVDVVDLKDFSIRHYASTDDTPYPLSSDYLYSIIETFDGGSYKVWLSSYAHSVDLYDPEKDGFVNYGHGSKVNPEFPKVNVNSMIQTGADEIWWGTEFDGIFIVNANGKVVNHINRKTYDDTALQDNSILSFYDDGNIVWVGTTGGGVSKFRRNRKPFFNINYDPLDPTGLHDNRILKILPDKDERLWIATWTVGLSLYDPYEQSFTQFRYDEDEKGTLLSDDIADICLDADNNLWVATSVSGLQVKQKDSKQFITIEGPADSSNGYFAEYPVVLYADNARNMWIGTWNEGLYKYELDSKTFTQYTTPSVNGLSLSDVTPYVIFEDSDHIIWLGGEGQGLLRFDPTSLELRQYKSSPGDPYTIPNDDIMCIHEDEDNTFWMGSYGGGLVQFDRSTGNFETFSREKGLKSDVIYAIFEDSNGLLWMSTNKGLARFNKSSRTFRNYGIEDGVLSKEFNPAGCQLRNGQIYFGGIKGITFFDPGEIHDTEQESRIEFTRLTILNEEIGIGEKYHGRVVLDRSLSMRPRIQFEPDDFIFTLEFSNLDYSYEESEQFAYLLEGFDTEWRNIGNRRNVSFTNLPPGDYTLKVKVGNADGFWGAKTADLHISVSPAFYETWWFISFVILGIVGGFILIYKLRTNFLKEQGQKLEKHNQQLNAEIQAKKEAHRIARERAEYFKAVISQSPVPMAIHTLEGRITHLNSGWQKLWGNRTAEEIKANYHIESDELSQTLGIHSSFEMALAGNVVEKTELVYTDPSGDDKIVHLLLYPLRNEAGVTSQIMISIDDITELINHRNLIERSLKEKELLLKEVHHRVKNNLQIIASLLGLQKASIEDENIGQVLDEFRGRVNSMALVHDALYRSTEFDDIDISVYLSGLLGELQQAFAGDASPVQINTGIEQITLPVDIAVPCGLIINELVTNALKYAFTDVQQTEKHIRIEFRKLDEEWICMKIADNGKGFQHPLEWESVSSLGLYLVKILSEQQLMGKVSAGNKDGAWIQIDFPLNPNFDG